MKLTHLLLSAPLFVKHVSNHLSLLTKHLSTDSDKHLPSRVNNTLSNPSVQLSNLPFFDKLNILFVLSNLVVHVSEDELMTVKPVELDNLPHLETV